MEQVHDVEADPHNHHPDLDQNEHPAADQACEVVCDAVGEGAAALDLAVEIADRWMVVLMLDQVARDVFDFSGDRHFFGCFSFGLLRRRLAVTP